MTSWRRQQADNQELLDSMVVPAAIAQELLDPMVEYSRDAWVDKVKVSMSGKLSVDLPDLIDQVDLPDQ